MQRRATPLLQLYPVGHEGAQAVSQSPLPLVGPVIGCASLIAQRAVRHTRVCIAERERSCPFIGPRAPVFQRSRADACRHPTRSLCVGAKEGFFRLSPEACGRACARNRRPAHTSACFVFASQGPLQKAPVWQAPRLALQDSSREMGNAPFAVGRSGWRSGCACHVSWRADLDLAVVCVVSRLRPQRSGHPSLDRYCSTCGRGSGPSHNRTIPSAKPGLRRCLSTAVAQSMRPHDQGRTVGASASYRRSHSNPCRHSGCSGRGTEQRKQTTLEPCTHHARSKRIGPRPPGPVTRIPLVFFTIQQAFTVKAVRAPPAASAAVGQPCSA
jgi:hypothetical protein